MRRNGLPVYRSVDPAVFPGYDGDGSSAGGDGGAGGGAPTAVTMEQVSQLVKDTVNNTVNNAISNLKKKDLPAIMSTALEPLNAQFTTINEGLARLTSTGGSGGSTGTGGGSGSGSGGGSTAPTVSPEINAQLKTLTDTVRAQGATITNLQTTAADANLRAETAERHAAIRTALAGTKFASDSAAQTAFILLEPQVTRLDDGSLAAGNLPLADFVKDFFPREHAYLIQSTGASGSGATGAAGGGQRTGGLKVDLGDIKPGMSGEKRASALADIQAALLQAR